MCLIGGPSPACAKGDHDACDAWTTKEAPGACKGFPSPVPCTCYCGHVAERERRLAGRAKINAEMIAIGRPDLCYDLNRDPLGSLI